MKGKRLLASGLVAVMTMGMLAGCGGNGGGDTGNAGSNTSGGSSASTSNSQGSGTQSQDGNTGEIVNLKWVTIGNGMPTNYDSWISSVNAYIGEKIGVNLEMEVIPWGDWDNRRNIIVSTNEPNMPGLMELMPEKYWDGVRVKDRIYGVPTYKDSSITNYSIWDKELVDEYSLDIKSLVSLDSMTETFETLKADKNDYPVYVKNDGLYYIFDVYDQIGGGTQILGVRFDDKEGKVCFTLEEQDIMDQLKIIHEWYQKGIINPDAATLTEGRVYNMWRVAQGWESAGVTSWGPQMGKDVVVHQVMPTILSNETVRGSLNMVSINTKYPEKCLQLLDLVNCDTKLRDLFYYGEEGVNFEYTADGRVHKINNDWALAGYTQGSFFTVTTLDTDEFNQWDEVKALNEAAQSSVMLGFTFDTNAVSDQLANCREIWLRYRSEVMTGVQDPEVVVPEIKAELMKAGWQDVMDEAQRQVDEFLGK